jgi:hypothetical protein
MSGRDGSVPQEVLMVNKSDRKMPLRQETGLFGNVAYCQGMILCLRDFLPTFEDRLMLEATASS